MNLDSNIYEDDFSMVESWESQTDDEWKETKKGFVVDSLDKAIWCFKKLMVVDEKEKEIKASSQKELDRIKQWEERELKKVSRTKEAMECFLSQYYREQKSENPKFKLTTPYGKVTSRKRADKVEYKKEDEIINIIEKLDLIEDAIKVDKKIIKKEVKKSLDMLETAVVKPIKTDCGDEIYVKVENFKEVEDGNFVDTETGEIVSSIDATLEGIKTVHNAIFLNNVMMPQGYIEIAPQEANITVKIESD